jgi:queuine tRNA-ribosyltransferase
MIIDFIRTVSMVLLSMLCSKQSVGAFRLLSRTQRLARGAQSSVLPTAAKDKLYPNFSFEVSKTVPGSKARLARITTPHGAVETPNFIFCATRGAMKALTAEQLRAEGSQIILSNTYHMMLTAGPDLVERLGGLQKFTGWNGPMFTDSGGYQIFSMGHGTVASEIKGNRNSSMMSTEPLLIGVDENGAKFKSYVDGSVHELTPEKSIDIQRKLGADLIVVLDECTPFNVDKTYTEESMHRSHRWAKRSLTEFQRTNTGKQALYGIVQGGVYSDLRDDSTAFVNSQNFFGTAIGGSLGDTRKGMHEIVAYTRARVRDDRPVHLLGIGGVLDIFNGVRQGIDTFDCVGPMRLARHGGALVLAAHWDEEPHEDTLRACEEEAKARAVVIARKYVEKDRQRELSVGALLNSGLPPSTDKHQKGKKAAKKALTDQEVMNSPRFAKEVAQQLKLLTAKLRDRTVLESIKMKSRYMQDDPRPIDPTCGCYTCRNFSRAYLRHCFAHGEQLGGILLSQHNAHYLNRLMKDIR